MYYAHVTFPEISQCSIRLEAIPGTVIVFKGEIRAVAKCCVGTIIYSGKCGKTVDAGINIVLYMGLNSGPKMADGKYRKT
jgi:ABC-type glucose/galactose transport system permease subunit